MPETLLSLITRYAVNRTEWTEEEMADWFAQHPNYCINYILRTALSVAYCFDGLKHTFLRVEQSDSIQLMCTFWYLTSDGESTSGALRFSGEVVDEEIQFRYSVIPASGFPEYDGTNMDPEMLMDHIVLNHRWPKWTDGVIRP